MQNGTLTNIHQIDETSFEYIFEKNVTVELKDGRGLVRCNVYRPKGAAERVPVLVTYGPYGKDVHYSVYVRHRTFYCSVRITDGTYVVFMLLLSKRYLKNIVHHTRRGKHLIQDTGRAMAMQLSAGTRWEPDSRLES